jgi:hypothetical protein
VYERIINPWVDQYESRVDDAVDEAHRGVRRWVWSRLGGMTWILMGEGGNLAMGIVNVLMMTLHGRNNSPAMNTASESNNAIPPSMSLGQLAPRKSVKEVLSESSSSMGDFANHSFDPTDEFVNDFMSMLQQGLYVLAKVDNDNEVTNDAEDTKISRHGTEGGFKLSTFSYTEDENGAFLISQVPIGSPELDIDRTAPARLPFDSLMSLRSNGSRGLILECHGETNINAPECQQTTRSEIILSDESDREILVGGLKACLPCILPHKLKA